MSSITYKEGYRFQLHEPYSVHLPFAPHNTVNHDWITFLPTGLLELQKGYAWDGPSIPLFNMVPTSIIKKTLRASAEHDAGYQLMRLGLISVGFKDSFDRRFKRACIYDGLNSILASIAYEAISKFGIKYAGLQQEEILVAP